MRVVWLELVNFVFYETAIISFLASFLLLVGCAVQSKPQGGPRDETPPIAFFRNRRSQGRLHFNGSEASVVFDEYIQARETCDHAMVATPDRWRGLQATR